MAEKQGSRGRTLTHRGLNGLNPCEATPTLDFPQTHVQCNFSTSQPNSVRCLVVTKNWPQTWLYKVKKKKTKIQRRFPIMCILMFAWGSQPLTFCCFVANTDNKSCINFRVESTEQHIHMLTVYALHLCLCVGGGFI